MNWYLFWTFSSYEIIHQFMKYSNLNKTNIWSSAFCFTLLFNVLGIFAVYHLILFGTLKNAKNHMASKVNSQDIISLKTWNSFLHFLCFCVVKFEKSISVCHDFQSTLLQNSHISQHDLVSSPDFVDTWTMLLKLKEEVPMSSYEIVFRTFIYVLPF